jgi:hypothetical protein
MKDKRISLNLGVITVSGSPLPPKDLALETPESPFYRETWFWEQVTYVLTCLLPALVASWFALAAKVAVATRDVVLLIGSTLSQFIVQKARSVAARQVALLGRHKARGLLVPEVQCASKVKLWTHAGQVLGAFLATASAPSWWHMPSILWALFVYDLWRNHREARKDERQ